VHSSERQRRQSQSVVITFPLIHFDCALAPAAVGNFISSSFVVYYAHAVTFECLGSELAPDLQVPVPAAGCFQSNALPVSGKDDFQSISETSRRLGWSRAKGNWAVFCGTMLFVVPLALLGVLSQSD
jgi:hypothetical protein